MSRDEADTAREVGEHVAGELRAAMARQRRTLTELGKALRLTDRKAIRARYLGLKPMTVDELNAVAVWLGMSRTDLLGAEQTAAEAVAS